MSNTPTQPEEPDQPDEPTEPDDDGPAGGPDLPPPPGPEVEEHRDKPATVPAPDVSGDPDTNPLAPEQELPRSP